MRRAVFVTAVLLSGCVKPAPTTAPAHKSGLPAKETAAAESALQALGKLKAATEVGTDYRRYSELVVDARASVDEAERVLPKSELRANLSASARAYADAGAAWQSIIRGGKLGLRDQFGHGDIITRYKLPAEEIEEYGVKTRRVDAELAQQLIWDEAGRKLAAARAAFEKAK